MLFALKNYLLAKEVKRYELQAIEVEQYSDVLRPLSSATLEQNFQNLRGRQDAEAVLLGFAIIVEMASRVLEMRPYRVQIMGALAMNDGKIVQMGTGEGKTLTAALPLAWNGLNGRAHAMTVNDYLARRDAMQLAPLYEALGLSCDFIQSDYGRESRQVAYRNSVIYSTSNEFVFDYLRDHIVYSTGELMQGERQFVVIDEADSILIDEARTPLVLSTPGGADKSYWHALLNFSKCLRVHFRSSPDENAPAHGLDVIVDEALKQATLTDEGMNKFEALCLDNEWISTANQLWSPKHAHLWQSLNSTLKAQFLYRLDRDYLIKEGRVIIIEAETGRLSPGKRWKDGLHQAIESKEAVEIQDETVDITRIALANYLRLYRRVSGMTGTAMSVSDELSKLYQLSVVPIAPHRPCIRIDRGNQVFATSALKWDAIVEDIKRTHSSGRPVLIGTTSVLSSESLSERLTHAGIVHRVLNAKQNEDEARIVAQAGAPFAVTIATNMAGRGTDILLGGNPDMLEDGQSRMDIVKNRQKVLSLGGLYVIGTERLESERQDLQLIGRAGRQGDPGESCFYVSLEDSLIQMCGGAAIKRALQALKIDIGQGFSHPVVDRAVVNAQKQIQSLFFESRLIGLRQDEVLDAPRKIFFAQRNEILHLTADQYDDQCNSLLMAATAQLIAAYVEVLPHAGLTAAEGLDAKIRAWGLSDAWHKKLKQGHMSGQHTTQAYADALNDWLRFDLKARLSQIIRSDEDAVRVAMLMALDHQWREFSDHVELVRSGIHLRAYAQQKPELVLKAEAFDLFKQYQADLPVVSLDFIYGAIVAFEQEASLTESQD